MKSKKISQTWVSPRGRDWMVHHPHGKRASGIFEDKADAVDFGRQVSRRLKTEFIVQKRNGEIQIKDSHGNDPPQTKG
ncbi:hypothetical protein AUJ46_04000 [Candidatus Peregrinibacteria bacterium CG1_02_54_53]|nr:MAG: hypothetical protein AUJ46_04000 [Candidatus Peregrinibacteria bacterium CG1_02_54_53]